MKHTWNKREQLQKTEQGFAIITAIFIIVVLAALGGFILSVSTNQQVGSALDIQGARAYEAARAGVEWGLYQTNATAAYNFGNTSTDPNTRACPTSPSSFVPTAATLSGLTVTVTCTATLGTSGAPTSFRVQSTACNQPTAGACPNTSTPGALYIERRLTVDF